MTKDNHPLSDDLTQIVKNLQEWQNTNRTPTLNEISELVESELDDLRQLLIETLINQSDQDEHLTCPNCEQPMMKNGQRKRKLKDLGGKEIELKREQMRCHQCGTTIFPPR